MNTDKIIIAIFLLIVIILIVDITNRMQINSIDANLEENKIYCLSGNDSFKVIFKDYLSNNRARVYNTNGEVRYVLTKIIKECNEKY